MSGNLSQPSLSQRSKLFMYGLDHLVEDGLDPRGVAEEVMLVAGAPEEVRQAPALLCCSVLFV